MEIPDQIERVRQVQRGFEEWQKVEKMFDPIRDLIKEGFKSTTIRAAKIEEEFVAESTSNGDILDCELDFINSELKKCGTTLTLYSTENPMTFITVNSNLTKLKNQLLKLKYVSNVRREALNTFNKLKAQFANVKEMTPLYLETQIKPEIAALDRHPCRLNPSQNLLSMVQMESYISQLARFWETLQLKFAEHSRNLLLHQMESVTDFSVCNLEGKKFIILITAFYN